MSEKKPNPEMLTLAREARGMLQRELASASGLSQPYLSQILNGQVPFTEPLVEKFSKILDFPESFFYLTEPIYGYGSSCLYHRKRASLTMTDYRRLLAHLNIVRINLTKLIADVDISAVNSIPRMDIEDYGSPALVAKMVRQMWGIPPGPINNLVAVVEAAGGLVVEMPFGTKKLDAISQWPPGIPPIFFLNSEAENDRKRFTLAHEIGHLILHTEPTAQLETEADEFAAEFLMPGAEIGSQLRPPLSLDKLGDLKRYWKVSMAAIIRRARDLGRLSEDQYRRLVTKMSAMGFRRVEPFPLPAEHPQMVASILRLHREEHGLSDTTLSGVAHVNPGQFALSPLEKPKSIRIVR